MNVQPVGRLRDAFVAAVVASVREERGVQLLGALVDPIDLEADLKNDQRLFPCARLTIECWHQVGKGLSPSFYVELGPAL